MDKANIIAQVIFLSCKEVFPVGYAKSPANIEVVKEFKGLSKLRHVQYDLPSTSIYDLCDPFPTHAWDHTVVTHKRCSGEVKLAINSATKTKVYYSYLRAFEDYAVPKIFLYEIVED